MKTRTSLATLISACLLSGLVFVATAQATDVALVTNGNNDGAGSLRAAINSGASTILIDRKVPSIRLDNSLVYSGAQSLRLIGSNQTLDGTRLTGNADLLVIENAANVSISGLNLVGNALEVNQDSNTQVGGKGIFVNVPSNREGLVRVLLKDVSVANVGNHGIHVSDCTLRDQCGGGSGGAGDGSVASVYVSLSNIMVNNVGYGGQDADGVRVDERGDGDIYFVARNSQFLNVGADGVELDEGNNGDVISDVRNSLFDGNGEYCAAIEFVAGSACDDDGDADVDDGFDIDEAGAGSLFASVRDTKVTNNFDEGLDFDEEDTGGISVRVVDLVAQGNSDEGIKLSEEDDGGIRANLSAVSVSNNNGDGEGVEIEEADDGNVLLVVRRSSFIGVQQEALKVEQEDAGFGQLHIRNSQIDELELEGVDEI